ncbi:hypothetical protein NUACC26_076410 [Scytonema sp. NUACC26]
MQPLGPPLEPHPQLEVGGFWLGIRINFSPGLQAISYLVNLS